MAKKSLLQTIGKWISNPSSQGTCFGLVGPPGVGKTLLAKSISKALDIPFSEITLGGQNDGEILHGHGYTYSGSQPGLIIKKMVEMGKSRCILYFDELDKACSKHGSINEITSILIHLTDPNMNKTFQDRFFQGVDFPLDKAIIIFSYNDPKLVDPILLDRIKQIEVSAYNIIDKKKIVKNFIIPELVNSIGLNN
jgi:ATP-dependent Lon protease